jgi:hypothetical protein
MYMSHVTYVYESCIAGGRGADAHAQTRASAWRRQGLPDIISLLLHYGFTTALLQLYYGFTTALLQLYYSFTASSQTRASAWRRHVRHYYCFTVVRNSRQSACYETV